MLQKENSEQSYAYFVLYFRAEHETHCQHDLKVR